MKNIFRSAVLVATTAALGLNTAYAQSLEDAFAKAAANVGATKAAVGSLSKREASVNSKKPRPELALFVAVGRAKESIWARNADFDEAIFDLNDHCQDPAGGGFLIGERLLLLENEGAMKKAAIQMCLPKRTTLSSNRRYVLLNAKVFYSSDSEKARTKSEEDLVKLCAAQGHGSAMVSYTRTFKGSDCQSPRRGAVSATCNWVVSVGACEFQYIHIESRSGPNL